jgi:hypothetical protein
MDEVRKHMTLVSARSANRGRLFGPPMWFSTVVLLACGLLFLGVTQRTMGASGSAAVATEASRLGSGLNSNAATIPTSPDELKVGESFTAQTKDHDYRFKLDGSRETLHLHVSAELSGGEIEWELIDPTGKVRTRIGITEHGALDSTDMKTIKGEWLLRIKLEDATGKYDIHWTQ